MSIVGINRRILSFVLVIYSQRKGQREREIGDETFELLGAGIKLYMVTGYL